MTSLMESTSIDHHDDQHAEEGPMCSLRGYVPILLALLILGFPSTGSAQWLVYDNFDGGLVNPEKWWGFVATGGPSSPSTDINRAISDGKLVLAMTQWGRNDSNAGAITGSNSLIVTNPTDIMGMEAEVSMKGAVAEGCPANPAAVAQARVRMLASFFNDGTSGGSGDRTGDIVADIETGLDAVEGHVIRAVRFRCSDFSCVGGNDIVIATFLTTWAINKPHIMRIVWDPAHNKFVYTVIPQTGVEEILEILYSYADALPTGGKFAELQVRLVAPKCTGSRKKASLEFETNYVSILPAL